MKDIYFNSWRYFEAKKLFKVDPIEAKRKFEEYILDYPYDYNAKSFYSYILIALNMPEETNQVLDNLEIESMTNSVFRQETTKLEKLQKDIITNRIRILSYFEKYEELLKYYEENRYIVNNDKLGLVNFICRKKLDQLKEKEKNKDNYGYLYGQIIEYDENEFLTHIQKHLSEYNESVEEPNSNVFAENFPIDEVIEEVKKYIPSDKRIYYNVFADTYFFKYNDCGRDNGKITNYFKVVCFHNTQNIITMCPVINGKNMPQVDLNYLNKDKGPVKTLSQIEKFRRRYEKPRN